MSDSINSCMKAPLHRMRMAAATRIVLRGKSNLYMFRKFEFEFEFIACHTGSRRIISEAESQSVTADRDHSLAAIEANQPAAPNPYYSLFSMILNQNDVC